jgi:hypothetical protein
MLPMHDVDDGLSIPRFLDLLCGSIAFCYRDHCHHSYGLVRAFYGCKQVLLLTEKTRQASYSFHAGWQGPVCIV